VRFEQESTQDEGDTDKNVRAIQACVWEVDGFERVVEEAGLGKPKPPLRVKRS